MKWTKNIFICQFTHVGGLINKKTALSSTNHRAEALKRFCITVGGVAAAVSVSVQLNQFSQILSRQCCLNKLRGGVSERGFRRFVVFWKVSPRKFLLLIRPLLPSRLPYVFVEGKVIPYFTCSISFFGPLNLIASFQEKSMFLPFTLFRVDVELDLCSLGGTGPG